MLPLHRLFDASVFCTECIMFIHDDALSLSCFALSNFLEVPLSALLYVYLL